MVVVVGTAGGGRCGEALLAAVACGVFNAFLGPLFAACLVGEEGGMDTGASSAARAVVASAEELSVGLLPAPAAARRHLLHCLYLRGRTDGFVLKGGDAAAGALKTMYDGVRPDCAIAGTCQRHGNHTYQPMDKKGAIILGTGGDNSNGAMGKFYEGIIATGATTDATDDAVQANIVAVGYRNI